MRSIAALSLVALAMMPVAAFARAVEDGVPSAPQHLEEPLPFDWDLLDDVAQQTTTPPPAPPPAPETPATPAVPETSPTPDAPAAPAGEEPPTEEEGVPDEDFSIGDIPVVETVELNTDKSRKALDVYVLVRDKYKDAQLENYADFQEFVDKDPQGKAFEADVKAATFTNVNEWNTVITSLSFAYDNSRNDQTADVTQQIKELEADTSMAQDMRERMITALKAMIPSDNNKKVIQELIADTAYKDKLALLESEEE